MATFSASEDAKPAYSFADFLAGHKAQLTACGIRPEIWGALYTKLKTEAFDAGEYFRIICEEHADGKQWSVLALKDLDPVDEDAVFLIDHAWTFRPHQAREQLEQMPHLLERMKGIFNIEEEDDCESGCNSDDEVTTEEAEKEKIQRAMSTGSSGDIPRQESVDARLCFSVHERHADIDRVLKEIWKHVNTYTIQRKKELDEESMPVWFVMDEFGARIGLSDVPNVKVVPFFYIPHNMTYSVMYMLKEVKEDEEVTRAYADHMLAQQRPDWKEYLYLPWITKDFSNESIEREPLEDTFFTSGRSPDYLPTEEQQKEAAAMFMKKEGKLKIFADDVQLVKHLKSIEYELVEDWRKADVLWLMKHFHEYRDLCTENPNALINQFPYESCLNVKDLLSAILMQTKGGEGPSWFQTCFNLNTELPQFVAYFQKRAAKGEDNTWIVKPWNLARGMDMHVSNDLGHMIRLVEPGCKIACKYITNPVLFPRQDNGNRVKFDLRFILFVNQLRPVVAYVYNKFWIRFAINDFSLKHLDDIETHFTVFNYADKEKILQMECGDFVKQLEKTYSEIEWSRVRLDINRVLREAVEAASKNKVPQGMSSNLQSRAMYGADIMLQWAENPAGGDRGVDVTLLECNFMPDCERACQYYPDFADTVFNTMFLDKIDADQVTAI